MEKLVKYKLELMGFSILWIMFFHSKISIPNFLAPLAILKTTGYAGVDIFFLLSGIGIAYSLEKTDVLAFFYAKRIERVVPTYWLILIIFALSEILLKNFNLSVRTASFFGLDFIILRDTQFWFIPSIMICYLFAPALYNLFNKRNPILSFSLTITALFILTGLMVISIPHLLVFTTRIPLFVFGLFIGTSLIKKNKLTILNKSYFNLIFFAVSSVSLYLIIEKTSPTLRGNTGLWWYPTIFLAYPLCFFVCKLLDMKNIIISKLSGFLRFCGTLSLELYLVHCLFFKIGPASNLFSHSWNILRVPEYLCYVFITFVISHQLKKRNKLAFNLFISKSFCRS